MGNESKKHTIVCFCENSIEISVPEKINLEENPDVEGNIIEGTFLTYTCSFCGKELKPELPVHIADYSRNIDLYFIPEHERAAYLTGKKQFPPHKRVVIGYPELVEKIKLYRWDLDDRIIEIIKFYLLEKAGGSPEIKVYLEAFEEDQLVFHLHGVKEDEIGIVPIPLSFYKKTEDQFAEIESDEQFSELLHPPYISIHKIYIGDS